MAEQRVVITGMGIVACNGVDVPSFWDALQAGRQGIGPITLIDPANHGTKFAGQVPLDNLALAGGDRKIQRRKDRFVLLALKAAAEAVAMTGLPKGADGKVAWQDPFRVATIIGAGIGGLSTIEEEHRTLLERGPSRVSPMLVPKMIADSSAGDVSIVYGAKGPNYSIVTACATATHCIGAAFHHIRHGQCDAAICGGAEAPITHLGMAGFNSIGALSKRNDDPATASRPFDKDRDGFVIAEGAGILVLESLAHAQARGATILGAIGAVLLKRGSTTFSLRTLLQSPLIIVGGSLYVLSMGIYLLVLRSVPLSIAYPVTSTSYLWILLLSHYHLKEPVSRWQWIGVSLIIAGITLLALG